MSDQTMKIVIGCFVLFAVVAVGILGTACHRRNKRMREATEAYRKDARTADEAIRAANRHLAQIRSLIPVAASSPLRLRQLRTMTDYYEKLYEQARQAIGQAQKSHDRGMAMYHRGVDKQNMYFGGASDISYLFWRRCEKAFFGVAVTERLADPTMVLVRAYGILNRVPA